MSVQHPSVLIVDDDPSIRGLLIRRFGVEGYLTSSVPNGELALGYLGSGPVPTTIVLDPTQTVKAGTRVLDHLRANRGLAAIPLAVFSAEQPEGLPPGTRFFRKPNGLGALISAVIATCGHRKGRRTRGG